VAGYDKKVGSKPQCFPLQDPGAALRRFEILTGSNPQLLSLFNESHAERQGLALALRREPLTAALFLFIVGLVTAE
jgi:hypothetical protein